MANVPLLIPFKVYKEALKREEARSEKKLLRHIQGLVFDKLKDLRMVLR